MDKKNQKPTRNQRIIQAAVYMFLNTHNFSKVSIEEIAGKAGVSPTTIYNLFGNRENLTIEVIKKISMDNLSKYRNIIDSDKPFPEKIKLIMDIRMKSASMDLDMLDKLVSTDKTLIDFAAEINEKVSIPLLTDFIENGRLQGYIRKDVSDESILAYLEILSKSGTVYYRFVEVHRDNPDIIEQLNDILFFGILDKGVM